MKPEDVKLLAELDSKMAVVRDRTLFFVLNAFRLDGLVVLGTEVSPRVCVAVAHSRPGSTLLLGASAVLVLVGSHWGRPAARILRPVPPEQPAANRPRF